MQKYELIVMAKPVEARYLSKTFSTLYGLQKLDKYSVLHYKRNSNYYEAREKHTTKRLKKMYFFNERW